MFVSCVATAQATAANRYRLWFDCDTTLPANVRVVDEERAFSSAPDALPSVRAPVCAGVPACRNAEPASER